MHACMHESTHARMCARAHMRLHTQGCTRTCTRTHVHTRTPTDTHGHTRTQGTQTSLHAHGIDSDVPAGDTGGRAQVVILQRLLPDYVLHMNQHPNTLLARFFGLYACECASVRACERACEHAGARAGRHAGGQACGRMGGRACVRVRAHAWRGVAWVTGTACLCGSMCTTSS